LTMYKGKNLRIAIDCRIEDPKQGIGTAVLALADALSKSQETAQDYTFVVSEAMREWLEPHIFGPCRMKVIPPSKLAGLKSSMRWLAPLRMLWRMVRSRKITVPVSDGSLESEGFDVVHFPTQMAFLTSIPSIYQPWDLQHLHYPQFFSEEEYAGREMRYQAFCRQAAYVCVQTEWTRRDVIERYGLAAGKVVVVRWGSVFSSYREPSDATRRAASERLGLSGQFFFYPAVTWPHKNHAVIFRALRVLRERARVVDVYFTGATTEFRAQLDELAGSLGVLEQVHSLGFVTSDELQTLFQESTAMLFPSKFEGLGLPVLEAFHAGVPVVCANATVLPEVAQDAALYFDPDSPEELAGQMIRMLDEPDLRRVLIEKGRQVLSQFSMQETVAGLQQLYALAAEKRGGDADGAGGTRLRENGTV
jgi:glycosyltransferase involved in cell wall biosynthesis